jgi:hypothetical protein
VDIKFFQQKHGRAMGSPLSAIVSNIFMQHSEKLALDKPLLWLWYVDNIFLALPHGPDTLQNFFSYLDSLRSSTQVTVQTG